MFRPTLDCILTYTTREGSLRFLMIVNNSRVSSMKVHRSYYAIGQVHFFFKRDGRTRKREITIGKWNQILKTRETSD